MFYSVFGQGVPTVAFPCALVCDPGLLKRADGIKKAGNVVVYNVLRRTPPMDILVSKNQASCIQNHFSNDQNMYEAMLFRRRKQHFLVSGMSVAIPL